MKQIFLIILFLAFIPLQSEDLPDPSNLNPTWWEYFSGSSDEISEKVEAFFKQLDKIDDLDAAKENEEIPVLIKKIHANFAAYQKLLGRKPSLAKMEPIKKEYTLNEQMEVATQLRSAEKRVITEKNELKRQSSRIEKLSNYLDQQLVKYLKMKTQNLEKLRTGLEIISLQTALKVHQEERRIAQEKVQNDQDLIEQLDKTLDYSLNHLSLEGINRAELERKIKDAENELKQKQEIAQRAETRSLGVFGETPQEKSQHYYRMQYAINQNVLESRAMIDWIYYQAERDIFIQDQLPKEVKLKTFTKDIREWNRQLDDIGMKVEEWTYKSEQELQRLGEYYLDEEIDGTSLMQQERYKEAQDTLNNLSEIDVLLYKTRLLVNQLQVMMGETTSTYFYLNEWVTASIAPFKDWLNTTLFKVGGVPVTSFSFLNFIIIVGIAYLLSFLVRKTIRKVHATTNREKESYIYIINRLIHYTFVLIGLSVALTSIGLNFSNIAIILGALSVGIGFGLQSIVNNFFSSLIILFSRIIKVGDYVELDNGLWGRVIDISAQNTMIHTWDGIDIIVPSAEMISRRLTNWTLNDGYKRLHVPFGVAYGSDKELVRKAVIEAAKRVPCTVYNLPKFDMPSVWLVNFGDSSLNFELVVWVNVYSSGHQGSIYASYYWEIETALKENGITIPFPQRDLHICEQGPSKYAVKGVAAVKD